MKKFEVIVLLTISVFLLYTGYRLMILPYQSSDLWRLTLLMLLCAGGLLALCEALDRVFKTLKMPRTNMRIKQYGRGFWYLK